MRLTSTTAKAGPVSSFNDRCNRVLAEVASARIVVWDEDGSTNTAENVRSDVDGSGYGYMVIESNSTHDQHVDSINRS
jgi:hypothetical protein